ncbi:MAG: sulfide/dihydroorotate dehydrogenase-like FAD/NAD-binding protein [Candidatus Omnitrophota bacterium]|nr:sulfide/dihydroorotate dehydrogenase-like FAD/NAD-binding protein [Candidatus Omnitrophota bacterium]
MPHKILEKIRLNSVMWKIVVDAPLVAKAAKAGQFVVFRIGEKGERIPLTVSDSDPNKGAITIIFQEMGTTTRRLGCLKAGDTISDVLGPLGRPVDFGKAGKVVLVAGGVGIAEILPIAKYAKSNGNFVLTIIGTRTKELLILEDELKNYSDELIITTNDGSYGKRALVIEPLRDVLSKDRFDLCYSVGPDIMMKAVCEVTKICNLKTLISLDANMVDATGMCGTCRVTVGGKTQFTCVDGPEFDGHLVDWDGFIKRQKRFGGEEKRSLGLFESQHKNCRFKV